MANIDLKDLQDKIEDIVKKLSSDKNLKEKFEKNPAKVLESILGVDLPDAQVNQMVKAIKAKLTMDAAGDLLGGLFKK